MHATEMLSYTLPPMMTAETAEELAGALAQLPITTKSNVSLDASAVQNISASGTQILVSLEKSVSSQGGELLISGQKNLLTQVFQEMGLNLLIHILR